VSHDTIELLVEHGEEHGCVNMTELYELITRLELEDEDSEALLERLQERGIDVTDDCSRVHDAEVTYTNEVLAGMTADTLQLFLNEIGRYPLLTAAQEVELAKRIERGDKKAKEEMINSNLRLVVSPRSSTGARGSSFRRTPPGGSSRPCSVASRTRRARSASPFTSSSASRRSCAPSAS
jgi:hypothetical protein